MSEELELPENQEIQEDTRPLSQKLEEAYQNLGDTEKEAWHQGWRPEEFFKGKSKNGEPRKFISAEEYLNKSKDALPVANERIKDLVKKLEEKERKIEEWERKTKEAEKKGYEKAIQELAKKQRKAVEEGDTEEFDKLKQEELDIIKNQVNFEDVAEPRSVTNPSQEEKNLLSARDQEIFREWLGVNKWFATDARLKAHADAEYDYLQKTKPFLSFEEKLKIVADEVKSTFLKEDKEQFRSSFESGTLRGNGAPVKEKSFSQLPIQEQQKAEKLMQNRGIAPDKQKEWKANYAKAYYQFQ